MTDADLIESVHQFRIIWDKKNPDHENKFFIRNAWTSIGLALKLTADKCEQRFSNIRNRYNKERRKMEACTRSGAAAYTVQWPHFAACKFLDEVIVRRPKSNLMSAVSDSYASDIAGVLEESNHPEFEVETLEDVLFMREQSNSDLTLHDVFMNRRRNRSPSSASQESSGSLNKSSHHHPINNCIPPTPSTSRTPSRLSMSTGQSSSTSHLSDEYTGINQRHRKKRATNSDDTFNLTKCRAGAFDKFDQLVKKTNRSQKVPLELNDEDYAFGRSVALSFKQIKSKKMKLIVRSKIITELAMAVNDEEGD